MNMGEALWQVWLIYWASAAFFGALLGSLVGASLALWIYRVVQRRK